MGNAKTKLDDILEKYRIELSVLQNDINKMQGFGENFRRNINIIGMKNLLECESSKSIPYHDEMTAYAKSFFTLLEKSKNAVSNSTMKNWNGIKKKLSKCYQEIVTQMQDTGSYDLIASIGPLTDFRKLSNSEYIAKHVDESNKEFSGKSYLINNLQKSPQIGVYIAEQYAEKLQDLLSKIGMPNKVLHAKAKVLENEYAYELEPWLEDGKWKYLIKSDGLDTIFRVQNEDKSKWTTINNIWFPIDRAICESDKNSVFLLAAGDVKIPLMDSRWGYFDLESNILARKFSTSEGYVKNTGILTTSFYGTQKLSDKVVGIYSLKNDTDILDLKKPISISMPVGYVHDPYNLIPKCE